MQEKWHRQEMSDLETVGFTRMLRDLGQKVGVDRLEVAIELALVECRFWPVKEDILARIPADVEADHEHLTYADPGCENCGGDGWVPTYEGRTVGYGMVDRQVGAAVRCACFVRNQQMGIKNKKLYGYKATSEDHNFRGSKEQRDLWREFMGMVKSFVVRKELPAERRSPTTAELAQTLGEHGHEQLLRKGPK